MEKAKEAIATTTMEEAKDSASEAISSTVETAKKVASDASEVVNTKVTGIIDSVKKTTEDTTTQTVEKVEDTKAQAVEKVEAVKTEAVATIAAAKPSINAKALFASCSACHGQNGEKPALGKSQIIKGWDKDKLITALKGYKDGSYGGVMKGVMKGQVATKSDAEIDALAGFISNL